LPGEIESGGVLSGKDYDRGKLSSNGRGGDRNRSMTPLMKMNKTMKLATVGSEQRPFKRVIR